MSVVAPDYRLLWLRRLDALWQARPAADSFWAAKPLFREMRGLIGEAYDLDASGDALWALVTEGQVHAVEIEDDHVLQIRAAGREALAGLEGPAD
jgi:hypothetical protein